MQKLTVPDYAYWILIGLLTVVCWFGFEVTGWMLVPLIGTVAWCLWHLLRLWRLMKTAVLAEAVVVNYSVKTRRIYHKQRVGGFTEEFQIYAPVLRYETETQILESTYPVYKRERWFRDGDQYQI